MYIRRIKLTNVRCFESIEISFDKIGESLLLLGDNGEGKSTLLRSIAMGLCDQSSASALFRELPGTYLRKGAEQEKAVIEIELNAGGGHGYLIETRIVAPKELMFERVEQDIFYLRGGKKTKIDADSQFWNNIFVSAYGAGIRIKGVSDFHYYLPVDAVYPLFKYDASLQNPELVIRRIIDEAEKLGNRRAAARVLDEIKFLLARLLDLESGDAIQLSRTGITLSGRWGEADLAELGDGYRSTVNWVMDFIAWWFLYNDEWRGKADLTEIEGIILIDEIEQHLHPRWQRTIISRLREAFPSVQFIATTHSPLCAAGTADLPSDQTQLVRLAYENGSATAVNLLSLKGMRADQILTSDAFSLPDTRNVKMEATKNRFLELAQKKPTTPKEKQELVKLRAEISMNAPDVAQTQQERQLRDELRLLTEELKNSIRR